MITNLLIGIFYFVLSTLFLAFPKFTTFPSVLETPIQNITGYLQKANSIFPVTTLLQATSFILVFEAGVLTFKFVNFAIKKLRGSG